MQLSEFDFPFDSSLVAIHPVHPRDQAKLMVLHSGDQSIAHHSMKELPDLVNPGDLLVVNDTKVRAARVTGRKRPSGTSVEMLFVKELADRAWEVMAKGRLTPGQFIEVGPDARVVVIAREADRTTVRIETALAISEFFRLYGRMPLPPYIKRPPTEEDRDWYQTVFAKDEGAIAAPTAGLHFTRELLGRLENRGAGLTTVTLHVGPGTFKPVTVDRIEDHRMGGEWFDVGPDAVQSIEQTRLKGGRVIAVGTTVVRALETAAQYQGHLRPYQGETNLFILPGFSFKVVDALLTNFHLPRTTLLMLVSALAGRPLLRRAYEEAVLARYRFYSYGDAMLIL
jgi:S-adenosylmethionine:tRNA ribosyltransferase-isomerase